jgi:hypothetical protein
MKRCTNLKFLLVTISLFLSLSLQAQGASPVKICTDTADTLSTPIPANDKSLIAEITLPGNLNGTDMQCIREMAGGVLLKDNYAVVTKDSLVSSQSIIIDHDALAKRYKRKSTNYGIAAVVFGVGVVGCSKYIYDHFSSHRAVNALAIGTVCLGATIGCAIASIVYHHKAGKQLKLSVKGTTASLVYTF